MTTKEYIEQYVKMKSIALDNTQQHACITFRINLYSENIEHQTNPSENSSSLISVIFSFLGDFRKSFFLKLKKFIKNDFV
jgi:hypothetical protein